MTEAAWNPRFLDFLPHDLTGRNKIPGAGDIS